MKKKPSRRHNLKAYKYWTVVAGKIVGGNEYREDAVELASNVNETQDRWPHLGKAKVYALAGLRKIGIDPNNNEHWGEPKEWSTPVAAKNPAAGKKATLKSGNAYMFKGKQWSRVKDDAWEILVLGKQAGLESLVGQRTIDGVKHNVFKGPDNYYYAQTVVYGGNPARAKKSPFAMPRPGMRVQSVLFDKDAYTQAKAKSWLTSHHLKVGKVDVTTARLRFRQADPGEFKKGSFRTIKLSDDIKAVVGVPKKGPKTVRKSNPTKRLKPSIERAIQKRMPDEVAATELLVYAENTAELSRQRAAIKKNLLQKIQKKTYRHELAYKAWMPWIEAAAKRYAKDFAKAGEWSTIFSPQTRKVAADRLADYEYSELRIQAKTGAKPNPPLGTPHLALKNGQYYLLSHMHGPHWVKQTDSFAKHWLSKGGVLVPWSHAKEAHEQWDTWRDEPMPGYEPHRAALERHKSGVSGFRKGQWVMPNADAVRHHSDDFRGKVVAVAGKKVKLLVDGQEKTVNASSIVLVPPVNKKGRKSNTRLPNPAPNTVPKAAIEWLVRKRHVADTDAEVRADIERRCVKSGYSAKLTKACGDYAVKLHHKNQQMSTDVMSGNIGSGVKRRRKSNPAKKGMRMWRIVSSDGQYMGTYRASSSSAALDAMARKAGYKSQADAVKQGVGHFEGSITPDAGQRGGRKSNPSGGKISDKKLGELMQHWHDGQADPIYGVGALYYAGKTPAQDDIDAAAYNLKKLRGMSTSTKDRAELQLILRQLELRTGQEYVFRTSQQKAKSHKSNPADSERARRIVKLAAKKTRVRQVKQWLLDDERGAFEKQASDMMEKSREKAAERGMTEVQVDNEIAVYLAYLAAEAALRDAKKRAAGKKGRKSNPAGLVSITDHQRRVVFWLGRTSNGTPVVYVTDLFSESLESIHDLSGEKLDQKTEIEDWYNPPDATVKKFQSLIGRLARKSNPAKIIPFPVGGRAGLKKKIDAVKIVIDRAEGLHSEVGKPQTVTAPDIWNKADKILRRMARTAPKGGGYDKTDFFVYFEDGEEYKGRFDLQYDHVSSASLADHIQRVADYMSSKGDKEWEKFARTYQIGCPVCAGRKGNPVSQKQYWMGKRVELHPGLDAWMRGDRYGEVVGVGKKLKVKLDKSGKTIMLTEDRVTEVA